MQAFSYPINWRRLIFKGDLACRENQRNKQHALKAESLRAGKGYIWQTCVDYGVLCIHLQH